MAAPDAPPSFLARFGPGLVANGHPIVPIMPGTKKPGRFRAGAWSDYPHWTRHAARATTDHELALWSQWPGAGVGVVCGATVAIDIDLPDETAALAVERLCRERLGDTPALRIGRAPKRLLAYRAATPFAGLRRAPIEVLGLGQQFVAHAVHPGTGRPYVWPEETLAGLDVEALPEIDAAMAAAFLDEAWALVPAALRPARLATSAAAAAEGGLPRAATSLSGTPEAVRAALARIPNADLAYDDWLRIGIARALYRDPDVLVLDEATSALDNVTERAVMEAVANLGGAKTVVMIAHRLTTVRNCDTIFLFEGGRVAAQGSYDELLETSASFRAMALPDARPAAPAIPPASAP